MARYTPLPSVGRVRPRSLRLADLYLRTGEAQADAELRSGAIKAQLFGDIGRTIGQTASNIIQAPQIAREQAAAAAAQARTAELGEMQLGQARKQVNEQENFDLAMSAGSRQKTLEALKDRPELYEKAQGHFTRIDTSMKQLLGDAAAGIADFGYTPEAAMAAMDDLLDQGFDERKIEPFRSAISKNPAAVKQIVDGLLSQSPDPRHQAMAKPKPLVELNKDTSLYDPNKGEVVAEGPKTPEPQKSLKVEDVLLDGRPAKAVFDPTNGTFSVNGEDVTARVRPIPPQRAAPQPSYQWAKDPKTGDVRLMSAEEIRITGAGQPDTADMRNKQSGKKVAAKAVDAVRALGTNIFTKVGPAQRATAIKRGAEAVWGTDPEFRTYQDSRMALAGTLAVEQQGSRVSDADVKALWLPMVPDAYRDTAESYKLKWSLIDAMRGVEGEGAQSGDVEYDMNGKPITKKPK